MANELITQCPACGTHFRVTPEQLQTHQGQVRCGRCMTIFDGLRALAALQEPAPPAGSTPRTGLHAPLAGEQRFDACVLGGGISGLSAALHLAERGMRVALLEARHLGYGGSGRSGGQCIFGYACEMSTLEKAVGAADARRMWNVAVEGLQLQRDLIARHAIDCDYTPGHMIVGMKRRHDDSLRAELDHLANHYGYGSLRLIGRDELRTLVATQRYTSALFDSNGGHLHPYRYTLGLGRAATQAGVTIFENSWVTRLDVAPASLEADHLVGPHHALPGHHAPVHIEAGLEVFGRYCNIARSRRQGFEIGRL